MSAAMADKRTCGAATPVASRLAAPHLAAIVHGGCFGQFALGFKIDEPGSGGSEAVVSSIEGTNSLAV